MESENGSDTGTMKHPTTVERASEREMVVTRTFNGPAHIVFKAWTTPALIMQWWTPKSFGITFISCEADVRTGGNYRFVFSHPAVEQPMAFFGRYVEVVPDARIVWTNEEGDDHVITTVTFQERDGRTLLEMRELWPSRQSLDDAITSGSTGASGAPDQFDLLDEVLAPLHGA